MPPWSRQTRGSRNRVTPWNALLVAASLLIGVTPFTAQAFLIYESAPNGPLATLGSALPYGDLPPVIVGNQSAAQSLGVKFHVSTPVTTGSVGGYFEPYGSVESVIIGAIVRLHGPYDFPNSFDLTTRDVLGKTDIHISEAAGNYAGDLSLRLTGGWYALVLAATDSGDALMPRMASDIGDPLYFFGRTTADAGLTGSPSSAPCSGPIAPGGLRATGRASGGQSNCERQSWSSGFEYLDGGGLGGVRMFVDSGPAAAVPEPSTLLLLGSGLAGLGGVAWRRRRQS
jgi:hypothetical protein